MCTGGFCTSCSYPSIVPGFPPESSEKFPRKRSWSRCFSVSEKQPPALLARKAHLTRALPQLPLNWCLQAQPRRGGGPLRIRGALWAGRARTTARQHPRWAGAEELPEHTLSGSPRLHHESLLEGPMCPRWDRVGGTGQVGLINQAQGLLKDSLTKYFPDVFIVL